MHMQQQLAALHSLRSKTAIGMLALVALVIVIVIVYTDAQLGPNCFHHSRVVVFPTAQVMASNKNKNKINQLNM